MTEDKLFVRLAEIDKKKKSKKKWTFFTCAWSQY